MAHNPALLGVFSQLDDVLSVLKELRQEKAEVLSVLSPFHFSEIQEILGRKRSNVRTFALAGGILGSTGLVGLAVYAHLSFRFITGGKPVIPPVPFFVPFFEGLVLLAAIFSVLAWVFRGGLPRIHLPAAYDPRFSVDRFGVVVAYDFTEKDKVSNLLKEAGAEEVRDVTG